MTNITNSPHCNPVHIDLQLKVKKFQVIRDNSLSNNPSIIESYVIWSQYFLNVASFTCGLSNVKSIINEDLPESFDIDIFMLHFDRLLKVYRKNEEILTVIKFANA